MILFRDFADVCCFSILHPFWLVFCFRFGPETENHLTTKHISANGILSRKFLPIQALEYFVLQAKFRQQALVYFQILLLLLGAGYFFFVPKFIRAAIKNVWSARPVHYVPFRLVYFNSNFHLCSKSFFLLQVNQATLFLMLMMMMCRVQNDDSEKYMKN